MLKSDSRYDWLDERIAEFWEYIAQSKKDLEFHQMLLKKIKTQSRKEENNVTDNN